ncbi:MAG: hypothetical protein LQ352_005527 [Teloschistes flavicans]|nr:MAG: hypothetical protein LQ352_005527 [Teloschistes flavicans]
MLTIRPHFVEQEGAPDTPIPGLHLDATNTAPDSEREVAEEDMEGTIPEHVQGSRDYVGNLFPTPVDPRGATFMSPAVPINPASDASQLISALDAESFHGSPRGQSRNQSPAAHSQASEDDEHSITSSMTNTRGYGQESQYQQYSEEGHGLADPERQGHGAEADAHGHRSEEGLAPSAMRANEQVPTDLPALPASPAQEQPPAHTGW